MNTVLTSTQGAVHEIILNRPQSLNALNDEMMQDFSGALDAAAGDPRIRCILLKGAGASFMAGGDVKMFHQELGRPAAELRQRFHEFVGALHPVIERLVNLRIPLVAGVQGAVAGFGVSLTMLCDFVIAADDSYFTLAYIHLGATPDGSSTWFLPRLVGLRRAKEIAMLGERIPAAEAVRLGLAYKVVPRDSLEAEAASFAARLASGPTRAYANTKALLQTSFNHTLLEQLDAEVASFAECASNPDFAEGVKAFVERRKAAFNGS